MDFIFDDSKFIEVDELLCRLSHKMCELYHTNELVEFITALNMVDVLPYTKQEIISKRVFLLLVLGQPPGLNKTSNYDLMEEYFKDRDITTLQKRRVCAFLNYLVIPSSKVMKGELQVGAFLEQVTQEYKCS